MTKKKNERVHLRESFSTHILFLFLSVLTKRFVPIVLDVVIEDKGFRLTLIELFISRPLSTRKNSLCSRILGFIKRSNDHFDEKTRKKRERTTASENLLHTSHALPSPVLYLFYPTLTTRVPYSFFLIMHERIIRRQQARLYYTRVSP